VNRYRDWLAQAERDLQRARVDVQFEFWEWACFTSQQATEKAVKGLLMYRGSDVWGHGITGMLRELGEPFSGEAVLGMGQLLDSYYIPTRYPNGWPEGKPADYYSRARAEEAVNAADTIIRLCEGHITR
jgi:HEPN domain-containing protein